MFKIETQLDDGTWTDASDRLPTEFGLKQSVNNWDTHREAAAVCADLASVGFNPDFLRVVESD